MGRRASGPHRSGAEGSLKAVNHNQGVHPSLLWGQASEVCHTGKPRPGELPGSTSLEASTKEAARGSPTQPRLETEKQTVVPRPRGPALPTEGPWRATPDVSRAPPPAAWSSCESKESLHLRCPARHHAHCDT